MSQTPITIPPRQGKGDPITAAWANQIREAIYRLANRPGSVETRKPAEPAPYIPWKPVFFIDQNDVEKFRVNIGTINGILPSNWNATFTTPTSSVEFLLLTLTTASGEITGATLSLNASAPSTENITIDTPPTSHEFVIAAIGNRTHSPVWTGNLFATTVEAYRASKTGTGVGDEPFSRYWRWQIISV